MRVVFVCTGNLCRSPMAEGLLRAWLARHGEADIAVSSMGTHGLRQQPPTADALAACRELGVDIGAHRSRALSAEDLGAAGRVFTMDLVQRELVVDACPGCAGRVHLLAAWPRQEYITDVVVDPIGQPPAVYRRVCAAIKLHVERIGPLLVREAQGDGSGATGGP